MLFPDPSMLHECNYAGVLVTEAFNLHLTEMGRVRRLSDVQPDGSTKTTYYDHF